MRCDRLVASTSMAIVPGYGVLLAAYTGACGEVCAKATGAAASAGSASSSERASTVGRGIADPPGGVERRNADRLSWTPCETPAIRHGRAGRGRIQCELPLHA